jgi:hypothetical protein
MIFPALYTRFLLVVSEVQFGCFRMTDKDQQLNDWRSRALALERAQMGMSMQSAAVACR